MHLIWLFMCCSVMLRDPCRPEFSPWLLLCKFITVYQVPRAGSGGLGMRLGYVDKN